MLTLGGTFGSLLYGLLTIRWNSRKVMVVFRRSVCGHHGDVHFHRGHPGLRLRCRRRRGHADQRLHCRHVHHHPRALWRVRPEHRRRAGRSGSAASAPSSLRSSPAPCWTHTGRRPCSTWESASWSSWRAAPSQRCGPHGRRTPRARGRGGYPAGLTGRRGLQGTRTILPFAAVLPSSSWARRASERAPAYTSGTQTRSARHPHRLSRPVDTPERRTILQPNGCRSAQNQLSDDEWTACSRRSPTPPAGTSCGG